ncbi:hypothetical protein EDD37DRAFT_567575 [Exophiala viscosa]|uniref:uncharacterized protein n=1 Tax=Exophiala viscosa TaxID=2486360 RepID=UPI0021A23F93|nr:hypothetical protein EDD37DRAFT_567575 [Exophiala viscosa]
MEVVAVSCSKPQWLDVNGVRTWTSIVHQPSPSIHLTPDGIEENDTAAHDAQVYAFFSHHYDYWKDRLGLPKTAWNQCHWGENITLKTDIYLDENQISLGDVWKVGSDVLLQVCGARVPYPNLLSMNKLLFLRKLSVMHDQELVNKNHWDGWRAFRPTKIVQECEDILSFYLEPGDKQPLGTYLPGQFLTVRLPNGIIRTWSISDFPDHNNPEYYRLSIKKASENGASHWMHTKCTTSTKLFVRSPMGLFHLDWSPLFPGRQIYMSAGIGITPTITMLKAHLKHYAMCKAPAIWVHVGRDEASFPRNLLNEVLDLYDNEVRRTELLRIYIFYTRGVSPLQPANVDECVQTLQGRPTASFLSDVISPSYKINPLNITPIEIPGHISTFYMCGTSSFEKDMKSHLSGLKVPEGLIRSEAFTSSVLSSSSTVSLEKATVKFALSDVTAEWSSKPLQDQLTPCTLLELAEATGLKPTFGCRAGVCGACKVKVLSGSVSGGIQGDGGVLICSARPASQVVEIEV